MAPGPQHRVPACTEHTVDVGCFPTKVKPFKGSDLVSFTLRRPSSGRQTQPPALFSCLRRRLDPLCVFCGRATAGGGLPEGLSCAAVGVLGGSRAGGLRTEAAAPAVPERDTAGCCLPQGLGSGFSKLLAFGGDELTINQRG